MIEEDVITKDETESVHKEIYRFIGEWNELAIYEKIAEIKKETTFEALQRLALKGIVEVDKYDFKLNCRFFRIMQIPPCICEFTA